MSLRRWGAGFLLLACAVFLIACGGNGGSDKTNQYKKDAKAILQEAKTSLESFQSRVSNKSPDQVVQELTKTRQEIVSAADRLGKLQPPSDVKAEHDKFVAQLRTFGQDFKSVEQAIKAQDQTSAQKALSQIQFDATQLKAAGDALEAKLK